jgi:hypothetical protein
LKPQKHEINKELDFLDDLPPSIAMEQTVDTNLNTLIDLPNEDCGATTSSLSNGKRVGLIDNDE